MCVHFFLSLIASLSNCAASVSRPYLGKSLVGDVGHVSASFNTPDYTTETVANLYAVSPLPRPILRMQHVSNRGASVQNRRIFSEPLSENDFRGSIYITSVPRSMHSKDPQEKYLDTRVYSSCKLEEIDAPEDRSGERDWGVEEVDASHHRIQKVGYDRLLMRALPGVA